MQSKDIIVVRKNNVSLCRPLPCSVETASSKLPQYVVSWKTCVTDGCTAIYFNLKSKLQLSDKEDAKFNIDWWIFNCIKSTIKHLNTG